MKRIKSWASHWISIGKYLPHYTPCGIPEYRDGPVFTTMVPLAPKEVTKEVTVKVHTEVGGDFGVNFRVKFIENFRVKFRIKGNQLDRMTSMVIRLSSARPLIVKELANEYNVSVRTIHEDLRRLEGWGIMKFEGSPKTGTYILTENGKTMVEEAGMV